MSDIYTVTPVVDEKSWESFIISRSEANFLQSVEWARFHSALGKKVFMLGLFRSETQVGAALVVKEQAKRGNYLTVAGGPLIDWDSPDGLEQLRTMILALKKLATEQKCIFIRFRPQVVDSPKIREMVSKIGAVESPMHLTADLTSQLDLSLSEEQILASMRKNTRYEIRKAEKLGILVKPSIDPNDLAEFNRHQQALAKKHKFVPFSQRFLLEQFKAFLPTDSARLFHAFLGDKLLASAYVIFYNQEAVYHYGISTPDNFHLPGAYACQWAAIKEALQRGCRRYNFWGVAPQDQLNHRFAGVSLFKRGFGGEDVFYLPAHDIPVSWKYSLVKGFERLRKRARKL